MLKLYTDDNYEYDTSAPRGGKVLHGVYFHGKAEEVLGHDIVCIDNDFKYSPAQDFEVRDSINNNQILTGKLYLWNTKSGMGMRGLAIMDADTEAYQYMQRCAESNLKE